jgi:hypothetical protein
MSVAHGVVEMIALVIPGTKNKLRIEEVIMEQSPQQPVKGASYRWLQLFLGIACMALIANLQYGWTLFVNPLEAKNHWGLSGIQLAFSIFVRFSYSSRLGSCPLRGGLSTSSARGR